MTSALLINKDINKTEMIYDKERQTSQVSQFCRETHSYDLNLMASRWSLKSSRSYDILELFCPT